MAEAIKEPEKQEPLQGDDGDVEGSVTGAEAVPTITPSILTKGRAPSVLMGTRSTTASSA